MFLRGLLQVASFQLLSFASKENMMSSTLAEAETFIDRRLPAPLADQPLFERRQFANSYEELSLDAAELARAIDGYKVQHRRRFVTFEEMLAVIKSLGYKR
jgi:hypothetical protein